MMRFLNPRPSRNARNTSTGSTRHKVRVAPSEDEDDEMASDNERLVEGGIAEAEIEQSFQAIKAAAKKVLMNPPAVTGRRRGRSRRFLLCPS